MTILDHLSIIVGFDDSDGVREGRIRFFSVVHAQEREWEESGGKHKSIKMRSESLRASKGLVLKHVSILSPFRICGVRSCPTYEK